MSRSHKYIFRLIISVGLVVFLFRTETNVHTIGQIISDAKLSFLFSAFVVMTVGIMLHSYKWYVLLRFFGFQISFSRTIRILWAGSFVGLILPSTIGGDVVRGYQLAAYSKMNIRSATSVMLDRLSGLMSLLIIVVIAWLPMGRNLGLPHSGSIALISLGTFIFFCLFLGNARMAKGLQTIAFQFRFRGFGDAIGEIILYSSAFWNQRLLFSWVLFIGVVFQLLGILAAYLIFMAVSSEVPLHHFFTLVPNAVFISMVPISISGIGVQDGYYVWALGQLGISGSLALSFSLLWHAIRIFAIIPGGIAFLIENRPENAERISLP